MQPSFFLSEHPLPVQLGGANGKRHECLLNIESVRADSSIWVHLVARAGNRSIAARDILSWDPVLGDLV